MFNRVAIRKVIDAGGLAKQAAIEDPTLDKFLDGWLIAFKKKTVKERTYAGYEYVLNQYVRPYLGQDKLSELTVLRSKVSITNYQKRDSLPERFHSHTV
jgi:hypothetical protein